MEKKHSEQGERKVDKGKGKKKKSPHQPTSSTAPVKQTQHAADPKTSDIKKGAMKKERRSELDDILFETTRMEVSLNSKRKKLEKLDKELPAERISCEQHEQKLMEAMHLYSNHANINTPVKIAQEKLIKRNRENDVEIAKLNDEISTIKIDLAQKETFLSDCKRFRDVLLRASTFMEPLNKPEDVGVKYLSVTDAQDEQNNESQESKGLESSPAEAPAQSSAHSNTLFTSAELNSISLELEEKLAQYISDVQRLPDLMEDLTVEILNLIRNNKAMQIKSKKLQKAIVMKSMEVDEEVIAQVNNLSDRLVTERERLVRFKNLCLDSRNEDTTLDAIDAVVTEWYCSCPGTQKASELSIIEKLMWINDHIMSLLNEMKTNPQKMLRVQRQMRDTERTNRREECLRREREERSKKLGYNQETSETTAEIPITQPVEQITTGKTMEMSPDLHAYLFDSD